MRNQPRKARWMTAVFVLLASILLALSAPALSAESDAESGAIVFARLANGAPGGEGIYAINPDGSGERPLFLFEDIDLPYDLDNGGYRCPAWSPDGAQLAFNGADGPTSYLAVVDVDGGNLRRVIDVQNDDQTTRRINYPEWVPGGERLSYGFTEAERQTGAVIANGVRTVRLDGSDVQTLVDNVTMTYSDGSPVSIGGDLPNFLVMSHSWSPSGAQLAIGSYNIETFVADADGSNLRPLSSGGQDSNDVDWSPDGTLLASSLHRLVIYRPDNSDRREITPAPMESAKPYYESLAWSPDGSRLVYATYWTAIANGAFTVRQTITVADVTTGEQRDILETPSFTPYEYPYSISCVDWRPDGAQPLPPTPPTQVRPPTATPTPTCTVRAAQSVNLRAEPSGSSAKVGSIPAGGSVEVDGQHEAEGHTWYRLTSGEWVRADVVSLEPDCALP